MTGQFARLSCAYALTVGDRLLPGAGVYGIGAVAIVLPDEATASAWIERHADDLADGGQGTAGATKVGDPWGFMRRAAAEGLAGIEGMSKEAFPDRFMFMVRVEEAGASLPTVLAAFTSNGWSTCLTRTGEHDLSHAELLHWQRFDILDNVTGRFGRHCPFRNWEHGQLFYELRSEHVVVLLATVSLLGHWNSSEGAFAFFTSEEEAKHYHRHHLGNGKNRMLLTGEGAHDDPHEMMEDLRPYPVHDLRNRLDELSRLVPYAAWCINPEGHREDAGCGRLMDQMADPASESDAGEAGARMVTVSGIWALMPDNRFKLQESMAPWSGTDTIRWSGGQALQLGPLDRSFMLEPDGESIKIGDDLTDADAEQVVARYLELAPHYSGRDKIEQAGDDNTSSLDRFHVVGWDAVTGAGSDESWSFSGFFAAARHLAAYERDHDRFYRTEGASSCSHIGLPGSGDPQFEALRGMRFRLGLKRLVLRVLRRKRYVPNDAADLVALCNGTLATRHIDYAGFAKDLLWAAHSDAHDDLLDAIGVSEEDWLSWQGGVSAHVDAVGEGLATDRMGEADWRQLLPKTRHFLATALSQLADQGHAPQLDYAPINLEIVKALEVELSEALLGFRRVYAEQCFLHNPGDHAEIAFVAYLCGGKAPTLGQMAHLLGRPRPGASPLRTGLVAYLGELPNGSFLLSAAFVRRGLQRVLNKFRNGGVHDSAIAEDTCRECVDVLIGDGASRGYIPAVASWRGGPAVKGEVKA